MKKVLTVLLALTLAAAAVLSLTACGGNEDAGNGEVTYVSKYESGDGWQTLNDPLTWEKINSFPIVSDATTVEEGRQMVVDFFRFCKTAVWIPDDAYEYKIKSASTDNQYIEASTPYGGLPYISLASGSIYRLMDYMDEATSVVDIKSAGLKPTLFGNQCSFGSYWGIGRVINSAKYAWTKGMTPQAGFVKVGDYAFDDTVTTYKDGFYNTVTVLENNGRDKMYECYAGLKHGDVIVYYTTAGHVVMISGDAVVEYSADGKIDPARSYVTVIDQTPGHNTMTNEAGDFFAFENNVDAKWTFLKLFEGEYVPFTFGEWQGTDPIESSTCEFTHTGDTITFSQLSGSYVKSNYGISDAYVQVFDKKGNEVLKIAVRAEETSMKELKMATTGFNVDIWGDMDKVDASKEHTVKIYAQLSTGERPVLWEGKLAK